MFYKIEIIIFYSMFNIWTTMKIIRNTSILNIQSLLKTIFFVNMKNAKLCRIFFLWKTRSCINPATRCLLFYTV